MTVNVSIINYHDSEVGQTLCDPSTILTQLSSFWTHFKVKEKKREEEKDYMSLRNETVMDRAIQGKNVIGSFYFLFYTYSVTSQVVRTKAQGEQCEHINFEDTLYSLCPAFF